MSWELNIEIPPKRRNGCFQRGHVPFNKGLKWSDYLDMRKARRIKKYLEIGRRPGNAKYLQEFKSKQIVSVDDNGILRAFKNAITGEKYYRAKGIRINRRNISAVCNRKKLKHKDGKYYERKKAGGLRWFFADDYDSYKKYLENYLQDKK